MRETEAGRLQAINDLATARLRNPPLDPNVEHDLKEIARLSGPPEPEPPKPPPPPVDWNARDVSGDAVAPGVPDTTIKPDGQQAGYVVLTEAERRKGFVRPVRTAYRHVGIPGPKGTLRDLTAEERASHGDSFAKFEDYPPNEAGRIGRFWTQDEIDSIGKGCGTTTTMSRDLAETYAREPRFYGATFCCGCGIHLPVGERGEFVWDHTDERVGT